MTRDRDDVLRIGYFGSYARGDWGVGSDLDLVIVVASCDQPFERRNAQWDATPLPVPTDALVYTQSEWEAGIQAGSFVQRVNRNAVWVYEKPGPG